MSSVTQQNGVTRTIPESMMYELFNESLKHGRLMKKIVFLNRSSSQEQWREEYFILHKYRLWFLNMKMWDTEKQWSYIHLDVEACASSQPNNCFSLHFLHNSGRSPLVFRCKSKEEAEAWIAAINNRFEDHSENDMIADAEKLIGDSEYVNSCEEMNHVHEMYNFEGVLRNRKLRKAFRVYLDAQEPRSARHLMFWERIEDLRISENPCLASENNDASSSFGEKSSSKANVEFSQWIRSLYSTFLAATAPHLLEFEQESSPLQANFKKLFPDFHELFHNDQTQFPGNALPSCLLESQRICFHSLKHHCFPRLRSRQNRALHRLWVALATAMTSTNCDMSIWTSRLFSGSQDAVVSNGKRMEGSSPNTPSNGESNAASTTPRSQIKSSAFSSSSTPPGRSTGVLGFGLINFRRNRRDLSVPNTPSTPLGSGDLVTPTKGDNSESAITGDLTTEKSTLMETPWRNQAIGSIGGTERPWLPDVWWETVKISNWEEQLSSSSNNPDTKKNSKGSVKQLLARYLTWHQVRIAQDIKMVQTERAEFRALEIAEDSLIFVVPPAVNGQTKDSATRLQAFVQPTDVSFGPVSPGLGSPGLIVISGFVRCRHLRRTNPSAVLVNPVMSRIRARNASHQASIDQLQNHHFHQLPPVGEVSATTAAMNSSVFSVRFQSKSSVGQADVSDSVDSSHPQIDLRLPDDFSETGVNVDFVKQYCVLMEWHGRGRLMLLDPATHFVSLIIELAVILDIRLAEKILHAIKLIDPNGVVWQLLPEAVDEEDARFATQRWLAYLTQYSSRPTSPVHSCRILQVGFLAKRGAVNKSFRRRWFVLSSDGMLYYYKDDISGVYKGDINLRRVTQVTQSSGDEPSGWTVLSPRGNDVSREKKELVLETAGRTYILMADCVDDCNRWFGIISLLIGNRFSAREDNGSDHGSDGGGDSEDEVEAEGEEED